MKGGEAGAALLEALVALLILSTACVSAAAMSAGFSRAVARAREVDAEVRKASALLGAASLWTRDDLDRRLGERRQGPWLMRIDRPTPVLYTVEISDSAGVTLLSTAMFRATPPRDVP